MLNNSKYRKQEEEKTYTKAHYNKKPVIKKKLIDAGIEKGCYVLRNKIRRPAHFLSETV